MSDELAERSLKFHAFEWLRAEALKGNLHAETMLPELANLPLENARLRRELGTAHADLAELRAWAKATVENCSVFSDPPAGTL